MFEDELTIFNKKYNPKIKDHEYKRTYLIGVNIDKRKAVNVIKSGLENANAGTIVIPIEDLYSEQKEYIKPVLFGKLETTNKNWTLQPGDIIVIGLIDYEIKENDTIANLRSQYDDVYEIVSVDDKLKGESLPHWEVGIK